MSQTVIPQRQNCCRYTTVACFLFLILLTACTIKKPDQVQLSDYSEPYRPQLHFSPPAHWMNDPNGLVFANGKYHLFYQHYPDGMVWGPMHWGHAISQDLIHWENLPIALYPDSIGMIFSGSAVYDSLNTSGLGTPGHPPLVAIFTYHNEAREKQKTKDHQTQGIAYSVDDGVTWEKFKGNPVIKNPGQNDFRDPKAFWHEPTHQWILILAAFDHVEIYGSPDLKSWTHLSDFGLDQGSHGGVWECPDLFPLTVKETGKEIWVMLVSLGDGGPNGGSATQYFLGSFDGNKFTNMSPGDVTRWVDYGRDNYAGVTWNGIHERRIFLGWMSNWQYAREVPTSPWRSAMTLPRELALQQTPSGIVLSAMPVKELAQRKYTLGAMLLRPGVRGKVFPEMAQIELNLENPEGKPSFEIVLSNEAGEFLEIGLDDSSRYYINRNGAGKNDFSPSFNGPQFGPRQIRSNFAHVIIVIDKSSVELFGDDGLTVMTSLFFPTNNFDRIAFRPISTNTKATECSITPMTRIWKQPLQ